jgi:soluble P-type ATPase
MWYSGYIFRSDGLGFKLSIFKYGFKIFRCCLIARYGRRAKDDGFEPVVEGVKMIKVNIPGYKKLQLKYLVLDYNGTLACDGKLLPGVKENLIALANELQVHVLTADTFGKAHSGIEGIPCKLSILSKDNQEVGKLEYTKALGAEFAVCIGNGRNDQLMLAESALGIAVILEEGAARVTIDAAAIVCTSIVSALELLRNPLRLVATLRS